MLQQDVYIIAIILAFSVCNADGKLQNREGNNSSVTKACTQQWRPFGFILIAIFPPRNFTLGVMSTVALNIRGEPSARLNSIVSQELLNPEIDACSAFSKILDDYRNLEVTEELGELTNKAILQIGDLQTLVDRSSCRDQPTINVTAEQVRDVTRRLSHLFLSKSCLELNLGCGSQAAATTPEIEASSSVTDETISSNEEEKRDRGIDHHKKHTSSRHGDSKTHGLHSGTRSNHKDRLEHHGH